jgi:hypothetical protein
MEECCVVCGAHIQQGDICYQHYNQLACSEGCALDLAGVEEGIMGE